MAASMTSKAFDYARSQASEPAGGDGLVHRAQQVGTVIQVGVIGLTIIIMILVYDQIQSSISIGGTEGDVANNTDLQNAAFNATDTFGQAMELAPVIMIILLAAVVIAVVQRFRG